MTDNIEPFDSYLEDLKNMDIDVNNLRHVTLLNGTEFIGELIVEKRKKDDEYVFCYPIKLLKDSYIDDIGEYNPQVLMVQYNICTDQEYIPINPLSITSQVSINEETLKCYVETLKVYYFQDVFSFESDVDKLVSLGVQKDNVISFDKYFKKV